MSAIYDRPVEAGAAVSWMIHAAKGLPGSGDTFTGKEVARVRELFDRAYDSVGYALVQDLKYRILEGERTPQELHRVAPHINWADTRDAVFNEGPANPTVFDRVVEAGATVSWMVYAAKASGWFSGIDGGEINRIRDFFGMAHQEFGYYLIQDLEERIAEGEIGRKDLRKIAPGLF